MRLAFDLEADGYNPTVVWCLGTEDLDTGDYREYSDHHLAAHGSLSDGLAALAAADLICPHNGIGFDLPALKQLHGFEAPLSKVFDTMVVGRLIEPDRPNGHSLEAYGASKGFDDFSRWSPEMSAYMRGDVQKTAELARRFLAEMEKWGNPRAVLLEHEAAHRIAQQMAYGFHFDVRAAQVLQAVLAAEREAKKEEVFQIIPRKWYKPGKVFVPARDNAKHGYVEGVALTQVSLEDTNIGSEQQLARWFELTHNWKPKEWTDNGKPKMGEDILRSMPWPEAKLLADYQRLDKLWSQVAANPKKDGSGGGWLHHVQADGRIHGYVNSNGAVTGRMTHSRPNTANADKDKRMRALWTPKPGRVLVGCDAEGLELRMLAHYLSFWDGGAYAKAVISGNKSDGTDPHSLTKAAVGLHDREEAKRLIYALLYGAGDYKLGAIIKADHLAATGAPMKGDQKKIGAAARAKLFRGLRGLGELSKLVQSRAKIPGYVKGLDGRRIFCRSQHSALNTLLQGGGAIVMKEALVSACNAIESQFGPHGGRWGLVANVHDEIQVESEADIAESIGALMAGSIEAAGINLGLKVPLTGKCAVGNNWSETH